MFCRNLVIRKNISVWRTLLIGEVQNMSYVKSMRTLEDIKTSSSLSKDVLLRGKYMFLIQSNLVCMADKKLHWKNVSDFNALNIDLKSLQSQTALLDVVTDEQKEDIFLFALDFNITSNEEIKELEQKVGGKFTNGREALLQLNEQDCQYMSKAKGLTHFNRTYNFCSSCGNKLLHSPAGVKKECQGCHMIHYPPLSPVGIVLLDDKLHENVLLVRQRRHPPGMYSCIAGFLEPGETVNQGIQREVAEEVGLELINIEYCLSQPWAMPASQIMLACIATVNSKNFDPDEKEILNAQWVSAAALQEAVCRVRSMKTATGLVSQDFWVPPSFTASHQLMVEWLKKYHSFSTD